MTSIVANPELLAPGTKSDRPSKKRLPLLPVEAMLKSQATLTAVERFAKQHDEGLPPQQSKYYRDLIPLEHPRKGEQYGFEVDLDACTGCKACVAACHTLNGLDPNEMWRSVGLLHGGTAEAPAQQTVTTSCHHCVDPACMSGCPVGAYEKDALTGIVKHLDDQCFGCQYCTLMCPYDAPKYNAARGIVRKCDMCSDRLSHGEAPACVQACPNEAISIRIVSQAAVIQASEARGFLPGAPDPEQTLPTTVYKSVKAMPANMLPADFYATSPEHSHFALVIMLTLTQLAAGSFGFGVLVEQLWGRPAGSAIAQTSFACVVAVVALLASVFHLGRPWLFLRAVLGLRTSWLSREALLFGIFAQLAVGYELAVCSTVISLPSLATSLLAMLSPTLRLTAAGVGVLGVFASVMVYVATRRKQWTGTQTGVRFFGTMCGLGAASVLAIGAFSADAFQSDIVARSLARFVLATTLVKLAFEAAGLNHAKDKRQTIERRVATVMLGDLRVATSWRFGLAAVAGIALPAVVARGSLSLGQLRFVTGTALALLLVADGLERYLFFRSAPASRMPGGIR
ncbi:MAG TPA: DmsC/YnfH family molybdoenzyme membrane anchor subunit [Polyangiaceae bacterium]|nr:DmsC/YnfH family molybdoenzyme membrane anchor subunit [Polyangiaceae bacterium]